MLFELEPSLTTEAEPQQSAFREVANYAAALRLYRKEDQVSPLSLRFVKQLHGTLMRGVRGGDRNPGRFRRLQNQVGRPARYVPPPPQELPALLDDLEKYLHGDRNYDPLVSAFLVHYQFEAIHPFMDGNGRVGRLLLALTIAEWCELADQWLYMSAYFDQNKDSYIDLLLKVSTDGWWDEWIEFCLTGVVVQANDTRRRCERLIALHREFHDNVRKLRASVRLSQLVDQLFVRPATTVTSVVDRCGVTYPTARSDLTKLERLGILRPVPEAPQISYYAPAILDVITADEGVLD